MSSHTNFIQQKDNRPGIFRQIFDLYYNGFKNMVLGRQLWAIILIKLFVMFAVLKLFFFPNFLGSMFETNQEKSDYVLEQITRTPAPPGVQTPHD